MNYHRNDEEMMRQAKGDEPITIDKLNDELESLLEEQAEMRKRNAYYIKNKTMIGYEGLSDDEAKKVKEGFDRTVTAIQNWYTQP